jgi:hypothetical protein
MTSLILMFHQTKAYKTRAVGRLWLCQPHGFSRCCTASIVVHLNRGETADDLPICIPVFRCRATTDRLCTQFDSLSPMPVRFETDIPQPWALTLLAPYISTCPGNQVRILASPILYVANSTQTRLAITELPRQDPADSESASHPKPSSLEPSQRFYLPEFHRSRRRLQTSYHS